MWRLSVYLTELRKVSWGRKLVFSIWYWQLVLQCGSQL